MHHVNPLPPLSRRDMLGRIGAGFGTLGLAGLAGSPTLAAPAAATTGSLDSRPAPLAAHFAPRAKYLIQLFMPGGPSQVATFDHKPLLKKMHAKELPDEIRKGQRLTAMSGNQASLPLVGSPFKFTRHGQGGTWMSDLLPHTSRIADEICVVKSLYTEAINHGPAVTHLQTGSQFPGRPSMGSWLSYGLGTENAELPSFVVLVTKNKGGQPLLTRLWGSGFLASRYQGVRFRSGKDPVLYLNNPAGIDNANRRRMLDRLKDLHQAELQNNSDPAIEDRISQYEMAFKMQTSIPEVTNFSTEPEYIYKEYGEEARKPGTFAANCLMARRLAERGVRFIQLYHPGWDQHGGLPKGLAGQCKETDRASAALVLDLKRRGLLEDTLVIWGGEFGRTNYCQGKLSGNFGRDHHPRCFSRWMAGGGVRGGTSYGETDPFCYNIAADPVHVHDFHATILNLLGGDHEKLTFKYQGRNFRLTDVHGKVIKGILT